MPALLPWWSSPIHLAGKCHISFRFPKARAIKRGLWDKSLSMQWHSMWGGKLDMSPATALVQLATICVTSYCLLWSLFIHAMCLGIREFCVHCLCPKWSTHVNYRYYGLKNQRSYVTSHTSQPSGPVFPLELGLLVLLQPCLCWIIFIHSAFLFSA